MSYLDVEVNGVNLTTHVKRASLAIVELADGGEVGQGGFDRDDYSLVNVPALKDVTITDSRATPTRLFTGMTGIRGIGRGAEPTANRRQWDVHLLDLNAELDDQLFDGDGANRPAETDYARVQWLLTTSAWTALGIAPGVIPNTNTVNMDATDYRGDGPRRLLSDCAEMAQKNYFVYDWSGGPKLYYDKHTGTSLSSSLTLSSDLADVDYATCYPLQGGAALEEDPTDVWSKVRYKYNGGVIWLSDTDVGLTTAADYRHRETGVDDSTVKSAAKATAKATAYLTAASTERHRFTCQVELPAEDVNKIRAGQRIHAKAPELSTADFDFSGFLWFRITRRTVVCLPTQYDVSAERYLVTLEFADDVKMTSFHDSRSTTPSPGTTTETPVASGITRYQLVHEVGAGPFGPDVLTGMSFYTVSPSFSFGALIPLNGGSVSRMPEANVPWEYTACGIGEGAVAGLTTREAWYRFQVNLADNVTGVKITIAPFKVVDAFGGYNDSPSGELVGSNTVACGIHTGASSSGAELTTEGEYTEVGLIGDGGGEVTISRDQLIDASAGYNWFVLAPNWTISPTLLICIPDPHPWGWGDDGGDGDSIVSISTQTHYDSTASAISYDPTTSGLAATDVQAAIDALAAAPAPPLNEVLTSGNSTGGIAIDGGASGTFGKLALDASGGILEFVGATRTSEVVVYDKNVEMRVNGDTEHGFYVSEDDVGIADSTGSKGSADQVLKAVGDDTAIWAASPGGPPSGTAGGELAGTYPNPTVVATHSGSAHHAQLHAAAHAAGQPDAVIAGVISYDPTVSGLVATDVQAAIDEVVAAGTPTLAAVLTASNDVGGHDISSSGSAPGVLHLVDTTAQLKVVDADSSANVTAYDAGAQMEYSGTGVPLRAIYLDNDGVAILDGASSFGTAGQVFTADGTAEALWQSLLTSGAGAPGGSFVSLLYLDTTAVTGGLYAWNGASYTKVAPPP